MLSNENIINLEDFRVKDGDRISKVYTGRDRGQYVREKSRIDLLIKKYNNISIIVPNNVYSINPSFLEEFLVNIVTNLGKEEFLKRVSFISQGDYDVDLPLNQAIDRILKNKTALDK